MRDPYELLAVPRSAGADDIKKSFRELAKRLHPDANNNDPAAAALFAELKAAHEILGDEEKRTAFDQGEIDAEGKPTRGAIARRSKPSMSHIVTSLLMVMVMLFITATLIMRGLLPDENINASSEGADRVFSAIKVKEEHTRPAQPEQPAPAVQSTARLIVQQSVSYAAGADSMPLGIQVSGQPDGLALEISGLPRGTTISSGRQLGGSGWRILAADLSNATIQPPPGLSGSIDLAVELRLADDTIVDRGSLRLQMPTVVPVPIESASGMAVSDNSANKVTATPAPADQNATHQAAGSQLDHEQIELHMARSKELISQGDIGAARTLLQRAAEARDARAALALAATYDPIMLTILQARGVTADPSLAQHWYKKASEFGSREAQQRLTLLADEPSADKHGDAKVLNEANKLSDDAGAIVRFVMQRLRDLGPSAADKNEDAKVPDEANKPSADKHEDAKASSSALAGENQLSQSPQTPPSAAPATQGAASLAQPAASAALATKQAALQGALASQTTSAVREPEMNMLRGGTFTMGSNDDATEKPIHHVTLKPFAISRYPISVREWNECAAAKACEFAADGKDDAPVTNVSWSDAKRFVIWLAGAARKPYRLPSEAEWEYAARGGTQTKYWWGDKLQPDMANCKNCADVAAAEQPVRVGSFKPNPFGLYDMGGGVDQWVEDCWHRNYHGAPSDGSPWIESDCLSHVIRSGSWNNDSSYVRPANRDSYDTNVRYPTHGFRVALREKTILRR